MAKSMPRAGRPTKTPGSQPAPRTPGATADGGTLLERAQLTDPGARRLPNPQPQPQGGPGS